MDLEMINRNEDFQKVLLSLKTGICFWMIVEPRDATKYAIIDASNRPVNEITIPETNPNTLAFRAIIRNEGTGLIKSKLNNIILQKIKRSRCVGSTDT